MLEGRAMGSMGANCYFIYDENSQKAAIVDPGGNASWIYRWVKEKGLKVEYILLTHGHGDHIGAVEELKELLEAKVGIHQGDADMLLSPDKNLSKFMGKSVSVEADLMLEDGQILKIGDKKIQVLATPGHSPGSVCFVIDEGILSGDTLFAGSIGRTDFPGGSLEQLLQGVNDKLLVFSDDVKVYPGHGEATTIGQEKRENPFLS